MIQNVYVVMYKYSKIPVQVFNEYTTYESWLSENKLEPDNYYTVLTRIS